MSDPSERKHVYGCQILPDVGWGNELRGWYLWKYFGNLVFEKKIRDVVSMSAW